MWREGMVVLTQAAEGKDAWEWGWDALSAMGTCAAVMVAVAVWCADKIEMWRRRRSAAKLLVMLYLPDIGFLQAHLARLQVDMGKLGEARAEEFNRICENDYNQAMKFFGERAKLLVLPSIDGARDRLEMLPDPLSRSLAVMISDVNYCRKVLDLFGELSTSDLRRDAIDLIRKSCGDALVSISKSKNKCLKFVGRGRERRG